MDPELLNRATSKCVASCDQDFQLVLEEPERDFGQVGGLAHAVDTDEGDSVRGGTLMGGRGSELLPDGQEDVR